jgi:hypothetical protein
LAAAVTTGPVAAGFALAPLALFGFGLSICMINLWTM